MEEYKFLLDIAIILAMTKSFSLVSKKFNMPPVVGALIAGIILGPVVLNVVSPSDSVLNLAEVGVVVLMFQAGLETDIDELKKSGIPAFVIALCGVLIPLIMGAVLSVIYGNNIMESIFIGVILTATSVSITVEALQDMGHLKGRVGTAILGAAIIDDILGIVLLSIMTSLGGASGFHIQAILKILTQMAAFFAISIIGGADGPTSIFLAGKLGQTKYMGPIAVAAYSYMSLVPIIQPPIMKLLTTEDERKIKMEQLRPVSKLEKILFPIVVTIVVVMILPTTAPLVGMLMLGNLFKESGVVKQLSETASNALMYIVVIILGTSVGATTSAEAFLNLDTLKIVALGLVAFAFGTAAGVIFGKIMCKATHGKVNPLIGSAGVSAVPMAARVSQKVGTEADPSNFLLMHAMGPNVAGVIGTAVAAGTFMAMFGVM